VVAVPLWAWIVLFVAALLLVGWLVDRKRRPGQGLDKAAGTENLNAKTPQQARQDDRGQHDGGMYLGGP
jgi:hypothetical protein